MLVLKRKGSNNMNLLVPVVWLTRITLPAPWLLLSRNGIKIRSNRRGTEIIKGDKDHDQ